MFREWLGDHQTIDLKQWAQCVGIRQVYLETLPCMRFAVHLIVLDDRKTLQETLRLTLEDGMLTLAFSASAGQDTPLPQGELAELAEALSEALPSEPPVLCTVVMDHRAAGELALSMIAEPKRAATLRTRLASAYEEHWTVRGANPLVQRIAIAGLTLDWPKLLRHLAQRLENRTIIWHRGGSPATRGGTRFAAGQFHLLPPEQMVNVADAICLDERLVDELLPALARALQGPRTRSIFRLRLALARCLLRGYVQPGGKAPPLRWIALALSRALPQQRPPAEPQQDQAHRPRTRIALYARIGRQIPTQTPPPDESPLGSLVQALCDRPQVKVSVGWTKHVLDGVLRDRPKHFDTYLYGVQCRRFEGICAACTRPFPLLTSSQMIRAQVTAWETIADRAGGVAATGFAPPQGKLSPGWSAALTDCNYRFLALDEAEIRQFYTRFVPTKPVTIEGWSVIGLHSELSKALSLDLEADVLASYLRSVFADHDGETLAVAVEIRNADDAERLGRFLDLAPALGGQFVLLSEAASMQSQGIADMSPQFRGLEPWTGDETNRRLNALTDQLWYHSCVPQDQWTDWFSSDEERQASVRLVQHSLLRCKAQVRDALVHRRPLQRLPVDAVGLLRIFDPSDLESRSGPLEVQVPSTGSSAGSWAFVDGGVAVPSQFVKREDGADHFLLDIRVGSSKLKDLVVWPAPARTTMQGLDITPSRLCSPWLAVLLDRQGQITSIRHQGQERLCGPSNTIRGHLLQTGHWLRPEREPADITVTESGPLRGTVTVRQTLAQGIKLTRHVRIGLSSPLLECITEIEFPDRYTLSGTLTVGLFSLVGEQISWSLPLQAGRTSQATAEATSGLFSAQDAIDVHTGRLGLRYLVHWPSTRTFAYAATPSPMSDQLELGLIASTPGRSPDPRRLSLHSGLGFPGHTYLGRYVYRYAVLPLSFDAQTHTTAYNRPLLWAFYPRQDIPS